MNGTQQRAVWYFDLSTSILIFPDALFFLDLFALQSRLRSSRKPNTLNEKFSISNTKICVRFVFSRHISFSDFYNFPQDPCVNTHSIITTLRLKLTFIHTRAYLLAGAVSHGRKIAVDTLWSLHTPGYTVIEWCQSISIRIRHIWLVTWNIFTWVWSNFVHRTLGRIRYD